METHGTTHAANNGKAKSVAAMSQEEWDEVNRIARLRQDRAQLLLNSRDELEIQLPETEPTHLAASDEPILLEASDEPILIEPVSPPLPPSRTASEILSRLNGSKLLDRHRSVVGGSLAGDRAANGPLDWPQL